MCEFDESGCERLLIAIFDQAHRDAAGRVTRLRRPADIVEARAFLAQLEADCADLVTLYPPGHRRREPAAAKRPGGPKWDEDWRGPNSRNVRSKAWRGMVRA